MLKFLEPRPAKPSVPPEQIQPVYRRYRIEAMIAVFVGYAAFYVVRNNFTLSTPHVKEELGLHMAELGFLSSLMLISYGCSKGVMSSLADKASPRIFMAVGLLMCAAANIFLGFSSAYWMFALFILMNGIFQGMGVGPAFITLANWFPPSERGRAGAIWNISHNVGGGVVAPIVAAASVGIAWAYGQDHANEHWQIASYWVPAAVAVLVAGLIMIIGKESPVNEGLPPIQELVPAEKALTKAVDERVAGMSSWQIFLKYILHNKHAWYVSFVDVFVYMIRFGVLVWLPIYLQEVKHFSKLQMAFAFLCFEWAAIPSTMLAGWLSDRLFHGRRMPLAMIAMGLIFFCIIGYWKSTSLHTVTFFAAITGCLIYIPQFLSSVQTIDVVPSFAVGSAVGLRGFMSYILGASLGTTLMGSVVHLTNSWDMGFIILLIGVLCCIFCCFLSDRGAMELKRAQQHKEGAVTKAFREEVSQETVE